MMCTLEAKLNAALEVLIDFCSVGGGLPLGDRTFYHRNITVDI